MPDKLKLLFVDDDQNILSGLRRMFRSKRADWDMRFACGGEEALAALDASSADVVVSDMKMPGMDGAQLLKAVSEKHPSTKRIVLSGQAHKSKLVQVAGFAHQFLTKPCQQGEMVETLTKLVELPRDGTLHALSGLSSVYCQRQECERLRSLLNESSPSEIDLVAAISSDVGISAKVFQLTATSFFAAPVKFGDIRRSLSSLGLEQLRELLSQNEVFRYAERVECESQVAEINRRSIREAKAMEVAGFQSESRAAERAYFQGLLRGVGALGILERFEDADNDLESRATDFLLSMWGIETDLDETTPVINTTMEDVDRVISAVDSLARSS